jgi:hypothetical protein
MPAAAPAPEHAEPILARIFHESLAATTDMAVLPGVLGCRLLRRTVQVRKPTPCGCQVARPSDSRSLRSAQSRKRVPSFVVSRQQFMKYPGLIHRVRISNSMKSEIRISKLVLRTPHPAGGAPVSKQIQISEISMTKTPD